MKELKLCGNIYNEDFEVEIRPYITKSEKSQIVEKMLEIDDYFDRQLYLDSAILSVCVNITEKLDYDVVKTSGFLNVVKDYVQEDVKEIYNAIKYYESVDISVKKTLTTLTSFIDKGLNILPPKEKSDEIFESLIKQGKELFLKPQNKE